MTKTVVIGKVAEIAPIEGADFIGAATVICGSAGKWHSVVRKDEIRVGDLVEVYLPDALLPDTERFENLRERSTRVKMMRFKGVPSEVLVMPMLMDGYEIGDDLTQILGVEKYEKPMPMGGEQAGNFPSFIPKTDEPHFQSVPHLVEALHGQLFYATVKMDGTSCTVYHWQGKVGVCSRNWEMKPGCVYWRVAEEMGLLKIPEGLAVQMEICGPGIQGNPMGLKKQQGFVFDIWEIEGRFYYNYCQQTEFFRVFGALSVPVLGRGQDYWPDDEGWQRLAEGVYGNGRQREGIVVRPEKEIRINGERLSFKVINLLYKN